MTVNSNSLLDADLAVVMEMSFGASTNWYNIRLALELHCTILDGIEVDSAVPDTCLLKMLVEWLRSGKNRTWRFNAQFIVLKLGRSKRQVDYILSSSLSRFHHSTPGSKIRCRARFSKCTGAVADNYQNKTITYCLNVWTCK